MADYNLPTAGSNDGPSESEDQQQFYEVGRLRRQYYDYLGVKMREVEEQKEARRYYHGAQWTDKEVQALKRRRQPVVTYNRIVRKIDAIVGLAERLRQDPKAFPRNPNGQEGADVATAVLRYALDHVDWKSKSPRAARFAAIEGLAGVELDIAFGDHGDPDIDLHLVYVDTFFYDPRSIDDGFTDARFMGVSKWVDVDQAKELVPDRAEEIDGLVESGTDLTPNSDREITWVNTSAKKVRLVDHWYIKDGKWCWCLYIGSVVMMEGVSPYIDERGKTFPKFVMFSNGVDHDGDRYGFARNLKSPQDEINHRRSKALHILNARRIISEKGAVDDVEKARAEWAKPDGWIERNPGKEVAPDLSAQLDMKGHVELLQEAKNEIENFGPNPALIGQGIEDSSGRAIQLLQQAGIAELGPYLVSWRTWKIRVYRAIWNIVQRYWTAERWIRVTDDQGLAQFVQLNGVGLDQFGHPAIVNAVGSLDVDIILDEGPDNINMMADSYSTLLALIQGGTQIPPEILIELAPLPNDVKQQLIKKMTAPDPAKEAAKQVALQGEQAKTEKTKADANLSTAKAMKTLHDGHLDARAALLAPPRITDAGEAVPAMPAAQQAPNGFGPIPGATPAGSTDVPPNVPAPPAPSPVTVNLDANNALGNAMMPLMQGVNQNSQAIAAAIASMQDLAQGLHGAVHGIHHAANGIHDAARTIAAPTELLRDPKTGRAVGARKVMT
jgi:hypothetical protein